MADAFQWLGNHIGLYKTRQEEIALVFFSPLLGL